MLHMEILAALASKCMAQKLITMIKPETLIKNKIHTIRGVQVMIDSDLAELYGVSTKRLNEQFKRKIERFSEYYF